VNTPPDPRAPPAAPAEPRWLGTQRIGRYEVVRRLALGGMAELFLGRVTGISGFEKLVAVKRILPHLAGDQDFVAMFRREARIAASLEHPNIVHVSDLGHDGRDYYLVMPFLVGKDLLAITRELDRRGETMPIAHAVSIAIAIAAGLEYAHYKTDANNQPLGIVHRDVSPSNIFVTYRGEIKLLDFGIARASAEIGITRPGVRKGKTRYMSPEQCLDLGLDGRSDVFSLGVILYELAVGRRLFDAENDAAALEQIVRRPISPPSYWIPNFPPDLTRIVMRALAQDRDQRYASARQFREELEQFVHERRLRATPLGVGEYTAELFGERVDSHAVPDVIPPPPSSPLLGPVPFMVASDPLPVALQAVRRPGTPAPVLAPPRPSPRRKARPRTAEIAAVAILALATFTAVSTAGAWWWRQRGVALDAPGVAAAAPAADPSATADAPSATTQRLVEAVNAPGRARAMGWAERHSALEQLRKHPAVWARVDTRLQLALDLLQAADAPDPCTTMRNALQSIAEAGDPWFLDALRAASIPAHADGCEGLQERLTKVRATISARDALSAPVTAPSEPRRAP
jgi:serine/threonine protein kinase